MDVLSNGLNFLLAPLHPVTNITFFQTIYVSQSTLWDSTVKIIDDLNLSLLPPGLALNSARLIEIIASPRWLKFSFSKTRMTDGPWYIYVVA